MREKQHTGLVSILKYLLNFILFFFFLFLNISGEPPIVSHKKDKLSENSVFQRTYRQSPDTRSLQINKFEERRRVYTKKNRERPSLEVYLNYLSPSVISLFFLFLHFPCISVVVVVVVSRRDYIRMSKYYSRGIPQSIQY